MVDAELIRTGAACREADYSLVSAAGPVNRSRRPGGRTWTVSLMKRIRNAAPDSVGHGKDTH
jgi:hypothetical protein